MRKSFRIRSGRGGLQRTARRLRSKARRTFRAAISYSRGGLRL